MWWILLFIFIVVIALLWPRSLKQRVIEAQQQSSFKAEKARQLYQLYVKGECSSEEVIRAQEDSRVASLGVYRLYDEYLRNSDKY